MERCVHKHLYNYMVTKQLLTPLQSGFREGDSTIDQLLHTYHTICEAVDKVKEIRAVFCDISKAFNRVWHKGILYKLRCMGCSNRIVYWFASYLSKCMHVLFLIVRHPTGYIFWLVSHKDRFLALLYFSFTSMTESNILNVLCAFWLMIQVCISLWTGPLIQRNC